MKCQARTSARAPPSSTVMCHGGCRRHRPHRSVLSRSDVQLRSAQPLGVSTLMEMEVGSERYWSTYIEDQVDGFAGFRLHRETHGKTVVAAEVIYWDATGGLTIETFGRVLQIEVAKALIAEAEGRLAR